MANSLFPIFIDGFQECNLPCSTAGIRAPPHFCFVSTKDDDVLNISLRLSLFLGAFVLSFYPTSNLPPSPPPPTCLPFTSLSSSICLSSLCFLLQVFFLLDAKTAEVKTLCQQIDGSLKITFPDRLIYIDKQFN